MKKLYVLFFLMIILFLLTVACSRDTQNDSNSIDTRPGASISVTVLVEPILEFDWVSDFSEGLAAVKKDDRWGYMDKTGNIVIPLEYTSAQQFREGLALVEKDNKYGYIDKTGNVVVPIEYIQASSFSEGLAAVRRDDKWGYINYAGNVVVPYEYSFASEFHDGYAWVEINGSVLIDKNANISLSLPSNGEYIHPFYWGEGITLVKTKDGKDCFIDNQGNAIVRLEYAISGGLSEGLATIRGSNGKYAYIDVLGNIVIPLLFGTPFSEDGFDSAGFFSEGLAAVKKDEKWGYIDTMGNVVVPYRYGWAGKFENGLSWVSNSAGGNKGCIDKYGNIVVPFEYANGERFSEGLAVVRKDSKWGILQITE